MSSDYAAWRSRLADANDPAFWPIEAIDALLMTGEAQFWGDDKGALVTRLTAYPGGAVAVEAIAAAGTIEGLKDTITPAVERWGRLHGCTHLMIAGRAGWARVHRDWRHHQSILIKDLADGL